MTDFEEVTDFTNLYKAFKKSKSGTGNRKSAAKYSTMALEATEYLKLKLTNKDYGIAPYNSFKVYEPKERLIMAGSFQDKVVQHCLCDNVLLPYLKDEFILDNYAGQINKGTLFGLNRLKKAMEDFYKEHGINGYILICDVTKYYYSIDHDILKSMVAYHFKDKDIYWLCEKFIDSTEGLGLPAGNQLSQVFSPLYLNGKDWPVGICDDCANTK